MGLRLLKGWNHSQVKWSFQGISEVKFRSNRLSASFTGFESGVRSFALILGGG